jgi:hypothetical protein
MCVCVCVCVFLDGFVFVCLFCACSFACACLFACLYFFVGFFVCTAGSLDSFPPSLQAIRASFNILHRKNSRSQLTVGARALAKHIHRASSQWWGDKVRGPEAERNATANEVLDRILGWFSGGACLTVVVACLMCIIILSGYLLTVTYFLCGLGCSFCALRRPSDVAEYASSATRCFHL